MGCIKVVTPRINITIDWVKTGFFRKNRSMSKRLVPGRFYEVMTSPDGYMLLDGPRITLDSDLFISASQFLPEPEATP